MNRRRWSTATLTVVCALTVLASPALTLQASAAPTPPAPRPGTTAKAPRLPERTLEEVRAEIDALYRQAAVATDAYNLAEEQSEEQSEEIVRLARMIVAGREKIDLLKAQAGAAARAQYRNGGLPDGAQFVLTDDPQLFLDHAGRLQQGAKATKDLLADMDRTQAELTSYAKDAGTNWTLLEANRVKQAKAKKDVEAKIEAAKKLESELAAEERRGCGGWRSRRRTGPRAPGWTPESSRAWTARRPNRASGRSGSPPRRSASRTCGAPRARVRTTAPA